MVLTEEYHKEFYLATMELVASGKWQHHYAWLATVQWILFTAGLVFVIRWIGFLSGVLG